MKKLIFFGFIALTSVVPAFAIYRHKWNVWNLTGDDPIKVEITSMKGTTRTLDVPTGNPTEFGFNECLVGKKAPGDVYPNLKVNGRPAMPRKGKRQIINRCVGGDIFIEKSGQDYDYGAQRTQEALQAPTPQTPQREHPVFPTHPRGGRPQSDPGRPRAPQAQPREE